MLQATRVLFFLLQQLHHVFTNPLAVIDAEIEQQIEHLIEQQVVLARGGSRIPVAGGVNSPGGGADLRFCKKIPKKCMKLRKFWSVGGTPARIAPLGSATGPIAQVQVQTSVDLLTATGLGFPLKNCIN